MEEKWLIENCKKGSTSAQQYLYTQYGPVLKSICFRYITDHEKARDTFHDCFLKIINSLKKYQFNGSFEGWLKRIVVNYCLDILKKESKLFFSDDGLEDLENESTEEDIQLSDLGKKELEFDTVRQLDFSKEELMNMILRLEDNFRIVFSLYEMEGYSHKEIAELLKIDEKTSRSRLSRSKVKLKKILKEQSLKKLELERR